MTALSLVIGLAGGLITGFYFERRARHQNAELSRQLSVLKTRISNWGFQRDAAGKAAQAMVEDLTSLVTARALMTQNAEGRVDPRELIAYFVERGKDAKEVEDAISSMYNVGAAKEEGRWLQLT
jgi:hypothetical protein